MLGAAPPPAEHAWAPRESFRAECPAVLVLREAPGHRTGLPGRRLVEPGRFVEESLFDFAAIACAGVAHEYVAQAFPARLPGTPEAFRPALAPSSCSRICLSWERQSPDWHLRLPRVCDVCLATIAASRDFHSPRRCHLEKFRNRAVHSTAPNVLTCATRPSVVGAR